MKKTVIFGFAILSLLAATACFAGLGQVVLAPILGQQKHTFSFEASLQSWTPDGADLGDPAVTWSVDRSDEQSSDGEWSAKFVLDNTNDAGKIWLVRSFDLDPNTMYQVRVKYQLGTSDAGEVNLWRIITGASLAVPTGKDDLMFQGETSNGGADGLAWMNKSYEFMQETGVSGKLYVYFGVWGTYEVERSYYFDNVRVTLTPIITG